MAKKTGSALFDHHEVLGGGKELIQTLLSRKFFISSSYFVANQGKH